MTNPHNLSTIVREWMERTGYDGLCNIRRRCACCKDDLMPCADPAPDCIAGYVVRCNCARLTHRFHVVASPSPVPFVLSVAAWEPPEESSHE